MNLDNEYNALFDFLTFSTLSLPELLNEDEDITSLSIFEKRTRINNLKSLFLLEPFENKISKSIHFAVNLEILCIKGYKCKELPLEIGLLENLRVLCIEGIDIEFIPSWYYSLKKIEKLFLFFSSLKRLDKNIFINNSLESIEVFQDKKIEYIDFDIFLENKLKKCFISVSENFYLDLLNSNIPDFLLKDFVFSNCVLKKGIDSPKVSLTVFSSEIDKQDLVAIFSNKNNGKMNLKNAHFEQVNEVLKSSLSTKNINENNRDIVFFRLLAKAEKINLIIPEYIFELDNSIIEKFIDSKTNNKLYELKIIYDIYLFEKIKYFSYSKEVKADYIEILTQLYSIQIHKSILFHILDKIKNKLHNDDELWKELFPNETSNKYNKTGKYWKVMLRFNFEKIYKEKEKKEIIDRLIQPYELEIIKMKIYYIGSKVEYKDSGQVSIYDLLENDAHFLIEKVCTDIKFVLDEDLMFFKTLIDNKQYSKFFEINMIKLEIINKWGSFYREYVEDTSYDYLEDFSSKSLDGYYSDGGGGDEWSDPSEFWG